MGDFSLAGLRVAAVSLIAVACLWGSKPPLLQVPSPFSEEPDLGLLSDVCEPVLPVSPKRVAVLADLYCRIDNPEYWKDEKNPDDFVTHAHELTHGVSNRLYSGTDKHGIYLLDGQGIILTHPKVTIAEVAAAIAADSRGDIFDLYLVKQQKDWNKSPLYLLDEWNSYIHGAIARRQGELVERRETEDFAREMERYCRVLLEVVKARDPGYEELERLERFIEWQSARFQRVLQSDL